jgi:radical SAM protein with 4Fe4S-binding SPASM domain
MDSLRLIAFEVTRRCRFNCKHCRADAQQSDTGGELTTEQCRKILQSVAKFNKCMIILTGGEPMERSDIYDLIRYGRDSGLRMVMATCGYAINNEAIAKLKETGLSALSISLDGASAQTHDKFRQTEGAFDLAIKAAKAARRVGIHFQINTTITKSNLREIPAIAKLAEELGAYCFNPFILVPTGRGQKIASEVLEPAEYEKLLHDLLWLKEKSPIEVRVTCGPQFARICRQSKPPSAKRPKKIINNQSDFAKATPDKLSIINSPGGCMGGRGFGFISYRGDVQTCGFLDISAGNLVENGFDFGKIWVESQFLKEIRNLSAYKGNCGICEYVGVCGGCRARAYATTGDYLAADPICNYQPRRKR